LRLSVQSTARPETAAVFERTPPAEPSTDHLLGGRKAWRDKPKLDARSGDKEEPPPAA
jgi:hypothetical protein